MKGVKCLGAGPSMKDTVKCARIKYPLKILDPMSKIIDAFEKLPKEQQEKVWNHLNEWRTKVYEPVSLKRATELQGLEGGNIVWKLKELLSAMDQKDIERMQRVHMTLPSIGALAGVLKDGTAKVLFKRAFIGFNQTYGWTFALMGHLQDESLAAGQAVGVMNHYMRAHPMGVPESKMHAFLQGDGGYWSSKVPEYSEYASSAQFEQWWNQYRSSRSQKVEQALEHYQQVCQALGYAHAFEGAWQWLHEHCSLFNSKLTDMGKRQALTGSIHNPTIWGLELAQSSREMAFNNQTMIPTDLFEQHIKPKLFAVVEKEQLEHSAKRPLDSDAIALKNGEESVSSTPSAMPSRKVRFL